MAGTIGLQTQPVGHRAIRRYEVGNRKSQRTFHEIDAIVSEERISLVDQVERRADYERDKE